MNNVEKFEREKPKYMSSKDQIQKGRNSDEPSSHKDGDVMHFRFAN
jgi:hypothetical protein